MSICKIKDCGKKVEAKGYCKNHYYAYRKHGDPLYKITYPVNKCSVDGCNMKYYGSGFCNKHWQKYRKYGDPLYSKIEMHGLTNIPEYRIWSGMKTRCYNSSNKSYDRYGGRGIIICDRWKDSFPNFFEDMGKRPTSKHQIDRIDNDDNYKPSNCRWITCVENIRNSTITKLTMENAREIREIKKSKDITNVEISKMYNVTPALIGEVLSNVIWIEALIDYPPNSQKN